MTDVDNVARVRSAYEMFNSQDIEAMLANMTDDVEWPDVRNGSEVRGKDTFRHYLNDVMAVTTPRVTLGDVFVVGDAVFAIGFHQAYGDDGKLLGPPRVVTQSFRFRGGLIARIELTSPDDIADSVRLRLPQGNGSASSSTP